MLNFTKDVLSVYKFKENKVHAYVYVDFFLWSLEG